MAFFDKLSEKLSSGATAVSNSTKRMSEIAKLNGKINKNLSEVNSRYTEIGRIVKLELADKIENEDIKRLVSEINALLNEVDESREKISELKGVKLCSECGAQIARDVAFCPNCGAKQEVEAPKAEEAVIEVITEPSVNKASDSVSAGNETEQADDTEKNAAEAESVIKDIEKPVEEKGIVFCSQCGNKEESGTKYCSQCGNKID